MQVKATDSTLPRWQYVGGTTRDMREILATTLQRSDQRIRGGDETPEGGGMTLVSLTSITGVIPQDPKFRSIRLQM